MTSIFNSNFIRFLFSHTLKKTGVVVTILVVQQFTIDNIGAQVLTRLTSANEFSQWVWVKGDNVKAQLGVYGTRGTPDAANKPGARESSATWTDASGNFWLFGGYGSDASEFGSLNDLWKYNPTANQWTWMNGDNVVRQLGVYGTLGTEETGNKPGARVNSVTWTDTSGNLWLFGGYGYATSDFGNLNDLWKYNPLTNQWTCVRGFSNASREGIYGTQQIPSVANRPGGRHSSVTWIDASGDFWLFGGTGFSASDFGYLNDLWRYNPTTNQWTWINGNNTAFNVGVYGMQGITDEANRPGGRYGSVSYKDTSGNTWLFGGYGFAARDNSNYLNDLWKYNPTTNKWTWVKGDSITSQSGVYGTKGIIDETNKPGARSYSVAFADTSGNFWLFGGAGNFGFLNDLWKYNSTANVWTWIKGDSIANQIGIYGTQGTGDAANRPGARRSSVSSKNASGILWLFGGTGYAASGGVSYLNDLWKFDANIPTSFPTDYFRTHQSGNWNDPTIWESSSVSDFSSGLVSPATISPDQNAKAIIIQGQHIIIVTANISIKQTTLNSGGTLIVNPGVILTVQQ